LFYFGGGDRLGGMSTARTKDRLLHALKTKGPQTAAQLARRFGITAMAVRQHLDDLQGEGLVAFEAERGRVGRPRRRWRVTDAASERFPDSHAELAVGLLEAVRGSLGEAAMERLLDARLGQQLSAYERQMPAKGAPLAKRVAALAAIRRAEGYMATWSKTDDGFLLVENHCPICAAAQACTGLCSTELALFERVLGAGVRVERTEHMIEGARRCAYRIWG